MKKLIVLPIIMVLLFAFCQSGQEKVKVTMTDLKTLGGTVEAYITDEYKAPEAASIDEMTKKLIPFYAQELPTTDAWGNKFHYKHGTGDTQDSYWIASSGPDGKFENFLKAGDDIVYSLGNFL